MPLFSLPGHTAGDVFHEDFHPVFMFAAQVAGNVDGKNVLIVFEDQLRGMALPSNLFSHRSGRAPSTGESHPW